MISFLVEEAKNNPAIEQILIFGSRARGDARERSDYDIAVIAPNLTHSEWVFWKDKVTTRAPTLLAIDMILVTPDIPETLRKNISKEGSIIYAKNQT